MPLLSELEWPRALAWMRVALGAAAIGLGYFYSMPHAVLYDVALGIFLVYSIFGAIRNRTHTGMLGLLALFGDAVYFLVIASRGQPMQWLAAAFFLYALTEAVAFYSTIEVVLITTVSAIFCAVMQYSEATSLESTVLVSGLLACGCAAHKYKQAQEMDRLRTALAEANQTAAKATAGERQRIASDFHDGPLQSFISLQMRLEILRKLFTRDINAGMEDLRQLQTLAQQQVRDLRAFLHSMRPVDLDGGSMVANVRRTAETFQKETGIPVTFLGTNAPVGLQPEASLEVMQLIREALHNVQKHSNATRVAVAMEKSDRGLEISIDDNGNGFNFAGSYSLEELEMLQLGPASLKRRARSLNSDLLLESRPGRGSSIKVRIPMQ